MAAKFIKIRVIIKEVVVCLLITTFFGCSGDNLKTFSVLLPQDKFGGVNTILETADFGYLVAGATVPGEDGNIDGYIIKLDRQGKIIAEKIYNLPGKQYFYNIIPAVDNGFLVLGVQQAAGQESTAIYVAKMTADLKQQWETSFYGKVSADCNEVIVTSDSGYLIAGKTDWMAGTGWLFDADLRFQAELDTGKFNAELALLFKSSGYPVSGDISVQVQDGRQWSITDTTYRHAYDIFRAENTLKIYAVSESDYYVIKLDKKGKLQWDKIFGSNAKEFIRTVVETGDHDFLAAGSNEIIKLDRLGNILWQKPLVSGRYNQLNSAIRAADGNFLFGGMRQNLIDEKVMVTTVFALSINAEGEIVWEKTYPFENREYCFAQSVRKTYDGDNYILGGSVKHPDDPGIDGLLLKIDAAGSLLWKTTYHDAGGEYINIVIPTSDGGYLAGGYTSKKVIREDQGMRQELYAGNYGFVCKFNSIGGMN